MAGKRVLIISKCLTSGGAEKVAANLASQLNDGSNKAWLLVFENKKQTYNTDAPLIDIQKPCKKTICGKLLWYFTVLGIIKKYKRELHITHSISFLSVPDMLNVLTKKKGKAIVSIRNHRSSMNRGKLHKAKDKFIFNRADIIVSLSEGVKQDLIDFYGIPEKKIHVIYNACDATMIGQQSKIQPKDATDDFFAKGKTVITAGRLTEQKGQWHLIRAFKTVTETIPDARLLILGQGEKKEYLQKLISDYKLDKHITLLGYHNNPYYFMANADIFVFPSLFEGFGNVLLEAMACGLPIICTDYQSGARELLAPGTSYNDRVTDTILEAENGLLVPVCDGKHYTADDELTNEEKLLAKAIINMLADKKLRLFYQARSAIRVNDFSKEKITSQWNNLIEEL